MVYYGDNGLEIYCDNGLVAETDDCPCGCPDFEGRAICYVDKKASGTGDGSSWTNAYTDIQTAVNAHPKKEIQIQGYGESDCYPAGIAMQDCAYLKGVGDVWIDGENTAQAGITDYWANYYTTKVELINIKNCVGGFGEIISIVSCKATGCTAGFSSAHNRSTLEDCHAYGNQRGYQGSFNSATDCTAYDNSSYGFYLISSGVFINCISYNNSGCGYSRVNGCTFIECEANNNGNYGWGNSSSLDGENVILTDCICDGNLKGFYYFKIGSVLTSCIARNSSYCGYFRTSGATLITCSDVNNCLLNSGDCSLYNCDEV
ncbi:MAG: hypothetical protein KAS17_08660 [Victivallaceae bacterium]|nr:hypothetical protein [Victivallaceae bacterium]